MNKIAPVTCHRCGTRFDSNAWSSLTLVDRLGPVEVRRMLLDWPDEFCIEIRRCRRCAREIPAVRGSPTVEQPSLAQ
jgi:hypothetical protein